MNVHRERIESGEGAENFVLLKSPGMLPYITDTKVGPVRGQYELNGHDFIVVGDTVYDYVNDILQFSYGPIANAGNPVFLAASQNTLMILSENTLYRLNTGVLTLIAAPATVTFVGIAFLKNYFIALAETLSQFYWSTDDGATFPAANVQTAEADANQCLAIVSIHQQLAIIGNRITQWFYVIGNASAPFSPIDSGVIRSGTMSAATVKALGESLFWLERNKDGEGKVIMTNGYNAERVSNHAVENKFREYARDFGIDDAYANAFEMNGHQFYRITFPSADATWEYNKTVSAATGIPEWEEVPWWNWELGTYHRHRGMSIVSAFGKILVGDHSNGIIYEMSPDIYHDFGYPLVWNRRTPHIVEENKEVAYDRLDLGMETGVGLASPLWLNQYSLDPGTFAADLATAVGAGTVTAPQALILQKIYDVLPYVPLDPYPDDIVMTALGFAKWGDDPQIVMSYSNNGGKTFSNELSRSLGRSGTDKDVYWNRMGAGKDRVWDFWGDAPCKLAITAAYFDAEVLQ